MRLCLTEQTLETSDADSATYKKSGSQIAVALLHNSNIGSHQELPSYYVQKVTQLPCKIGMDQRLQALLKPITDPLVQMGIGKRVINHESRLVYFHKK